MPSWSGRIPFRLQSSSLLTRLLLVEGAVFLVLVAGVLGATKWFADDLRDRIEHERLVATRAFASEIDQMLRQGFDSLRFLSTSAALLESRDLLVVTLDSFSQDSSLFGRGVLEVDSDFQVVASSSASRYLLGTSLAAGFDGSSAGSAGVLAWGFRPQEDATPVIAIAVPRRRATTAGGYFVGFIDAVDSNVGSIIEQARRISETGHADLVNEEGVALASTDADHLLVSSDHPAFYRSALWASFPPAVTEVAYVEPDGSTNGTHVMGFASLEMLPWGFAVGGSTASTFAPIRQLWLAVLSLAFVLGNFALTVTVIGTARLVRPVHQLRDSARRVAGGDVDTPIAPTTTGGEIGELAESIESMRSALFDWGTQLDRRVNERTEQLERRSRELATSAAIARAVASTLDLGSVLEAAADEIEQHLGVDGVVIYAQDDGGRPLTVRCSSGVDASSIGADPAPCQQCLALAGDRTSYVLEASALGPSEMPRCLRNGYHAVTIVPLRWVDRQVGALCILESASSAQSIDVDLLNLLASQISVGIRNATLYSESLRREAHRQALLTKVLSSQEEERRRLARELHDDAGQMLTGLLMGLDGIALSIPERPAAALRQVERMRALSEEMLGNLRSMVLALRPPVLDDIGLVPAIERYAETAIRQRGIDFQIDSSLGADRLAPDWEVAIFRIVQESLNNIARHSNAGSASVRIEHGPARLSVEVKDDGDGFERPASDDPLVGVGIEGMMERAELLGGELWVDSVPGRGTTVRLEVHDDVRFASSHDREHAERGDSR